MEIKRRDWNRAEADQGFLSHNHTLEVIRILGIDLEIRELSDLQTMAKSEYRSLFKGNGIEFAVTTIINIDTSTYTYIHKSIPGSIRELPANQYKVLPNADIRRPEGRELREKTIHDALIFIGVIKAKMATVVKKSDGGIVIRVDEFGNRTLDYSGLRANVVKSESDARVLNYADFNRISDVKEPPKKH